MANEINETGSSSETRNTLESAVKDATNAGDSTSAATIQSYLDGLGSSSGDGGSGGSGGAGSGSSSGEPSLDVDGMLDTAEQDLEATEQTEDGLDKSTGDDIGADDAEKESREAELRANKALRDEQNLMRSGIGQLEDDSNEKNADQTGDPVLVSNGQYVQEERDLDTGGTAGFNFERVYRTDYPVGGQRGRAAAVRG